MSNLKLKHTVKSYADAVAALKGRDSIILGHNTRLARTSDQEITVRYHGNAIVRYSPEGVEASWAGWATSTTTNRLHMLTPSGVRFNISKFEPCINGEVVSASGWHAVS